MFCCTFNITFCHFNITSGSVNTLRQLYKRQTEMAYKALGDQDDNGNYPYTATQKSKKSAADSDEEGPLESNIVWSEFSFGKPDEKLQDKPARKVSRQEEDRKVDKNPFGYLFGNQPERATSPKPDYSTTDSAPPPPPPPPSGSMGVPPPPRFNSQGTLINYGKKDSPPQSVGRQNSQSSHDSSQRGRSPSPRRPPSPPRAPPAPLYKPPSPVVRNPPSPAQPSPPRTLRSVSPVRGPYGLYGVQNEGAPERRPSETMTSTPRTHRQTSEDDVYVSWIFISSLLLKCMNCPKLFETPDSKYIDVASLLTVNNTCCSVMLK